MKSIFIGNEKQINRVYPADIKQQLVLEAGLDNSVVITQEKLAEMACYLKDTEYAFTTWDMPSLTENEIKSYFPSLKALFYAAGSVQSFALPFLNSGIKVFSAWGANAVPVAEYVVSQIVLANKGFFQACNYSSNCHGELARNHLLAFPGNYRCKAGIIGVGMIGSMVIERLKDYQLEILAFDPFLSDERAKQLGIEVCSLERLFKECQTISNHLANNAQTVGMLNYALFASMPDYATFLNTGRGAQVVEDDLARALAERPTLTAVLDVTYPEPPITGHAFYSLPNVFLTPHIAGSSGNEVIRMAEYMLEEYRNLSSGRSTRYEVTPKMLETMA